MAWLNVQSNTSKKTSKKASKMQSSKNGPSSLLLEALAEKLRLDLNNFNVLAKRELEAMRRQHQTICEKAGIPDMRATSSSETMMLEKQRLILGVIEQAGALQKR